MKTAIWILIKFVLRITWLVLTLTVIAPLLMWAFTGDIDNWFELQDAIKTQ
jgi:hypothetical protein